MTVCPIAIAVGCKRCAIFSVCPVKSVIGDYHPTKSEAPAPPRAAVATRKARTKSKSKTKR